MNPDFVGVRARWRNVVEILAIVVRKEMKQEYELGLSEMYAILDGADYVDSVEDENNKLKTELIRVIQKECDTQLRRFRAEKENARLREALSTIVDAQNRGTERVSDETVLAFVIGVSRAALAGKEKVLVLEHFDGERKWTTCGACGSVLAGKEKE